MGAGREGAEGEGQVNVSDGVKPCNCLPYFGVKEDTSTVGCDEMMQVDRLAFPHRRGLDHAQMGDGFVRLMGRVSCCVLHKRNTSGRTAPLCGESEPIVSQFSAPTAVVQIVSCRNLYQSIPSRPKVFVQGAGV